MEQIPVIVARDRRGATTDAVLPRGIALGISLTRESVLARFGGDRFYLRDTATAAGARIGPVYGLL